MSNTENSNRIVATIIPTSKEIEVDSYYFSSGGVATLFIKDGGSMITSATNVIIHDIERKHTLN